MKKIFTTLFAGLLISAQVMAITVMDVCGRYDGTLLLDSEEYPESQVYLLPGVTDNTLTFVLPDFKFNGVSLGSIVLQILLSARMVSLPLRRPLSIWQVS